MICIYVTNKVCFIALNVIKKKFNSLLVNMTHFEFSKL